MIPSTLPTLSLHVLPSPGGIDWSSPLALARSAVRSTLLPGNRDIGHVAVELVGRFGRVLTGMTDAGLRAVRILAWERTGFGVLFRGYPGRLEQAQDLDRELAAKCGTSRRSCLRLQLSEGAYERVHRYLVEFRQLGVSEVYGLPHRPRHREGAGCSAFAASCLDVVGALGEELDAAWAVSVRVPMALLGPPFTTRGVPLGRLLLTGPRRWARADEPHQALQCWDPDSLHRFLAGDPRTRTLGGVPTLEVDATSLCTPSDPLWRAPEDDVLWRRSA
ncbi:MAG: hypothetical protein KTR31_11790 [Myxococcales bacterium]|nr:hypothetical protein [Myxococcales bacterium]